MAAGIRDGVRGTLAAGGVAGGRVQVGALGLQPGGGLPGRGYRRRALWRPGRWQRPEAWLQLVRGDVLAGGQRGMQVVIQQPAGRGVGVGRVVGGGQGAGVFAEQVVQLVAAGGGLGEQVLVIQLLQAAAGGVQAGAVERGGGVGVEVGAWDAGRAGGTAAAGLR